jgi:hypothetical protein
VVLLVGAAPEILIGSDCSTEALRVSFFAFVTTAGSTSTERSAGLSTALLELMSDLVEIAGDARPGG